MSNLWFGCGDALGCGLSGGKIPDTAEILLRLGGAISYLWFGCGEALGWGLSGGNIEVDGATG